MKVKNLNGTASNKCKCGSWLAHWVKFGSGELPLYCSETHCMSTPDVGAHVQKDNSSDNNWYIIPLCREHNKLTGKSLVINDLIQLVPANVSETCEK